MLAIVLAVLVGTGAMASVDVTGVWNVTWQSLIGPLPAELSFVQSGSDLTLTVSVDGGGVQGPYSGTIDPDLGTFTVPLPDSMGPFPGLICTGNAISGSVTPDGFSMSGTWISKFYKITPPVGCFDGGGPFAGNIQSCGNGIVEPGESCDDGSQTDGDCCSADCQVVAPDGNACDDGDACTVVDSCASGLCAGSGAVTCDPCEICDSALGCTVQTATACQPALSGKSTFTLKTFAANAMEKNLAWKWKSSAAVPIADFGDPLTTSQYSLCVIDQLGGAPTLRMSLGAPAAELCAGRPCWTATSSKYRYKNIDAASPALTVLSLGAGTGPGRAKLKAKGKGALLDVPDAALVPPVVVRLIRDDASTCWDATYSSPKRNDMKSFKAKAD